MLKDYLIKQEDNKYHLYIKLTPNSKFNKIGGTFYDENNILYIKAYTTIIPEDNKANAELIKMVSKSIKIPKSNINIIKGNKSKFKLLEINI